MKKYSRIAVFVFAAAFLFSVLTAVMTPEWKLVVRVKGTVESLAAKTSDWIYIHQARLLKDGDKARTLKDSRAKIQLADQSVVTLGADTVVELEQFKLKGNSRIVELKMEIGRLRANVAKFLKGESRFEIRSTNATLAARGTEFYVDLQGDNPDAAGGGGLTGAYINGQVSQSGGPGGANMFLSVFSGAVEAKTQVGTHVFQAGDIGLINSQGSIFVNPSQIPSSFTSSASWKQDNDLRESSGSSGGGQGGTSGGQGNQSGNDNNQGDNQSNQGNQDNQGNQNNQGTQQGSQNATPTGSTAPGAPMAPPPAFIQPFIEPNNPNIDANSNTNAPTKPNTGTIHINIK